MGLLFPVNIVRLLRKAATDSAIDFARISPLEVAAGIFANYLAALQKEQPLSIVTKKIGPLGGQLIEPTPFFRATPGFIVQMERESKIAGLADRVAGYFTDSLLIADLRRGIEAARRRTPVNSLERLIDLRIERMKKIQVVAWSPGNEPEANSLNLNAEIWWAI